MLLRFLLIQSLMLWQGGFLFYAVVVVPIGSDVVGAIDQGFITRRVALWMIYCGIVSTSLMFLDEQWTRDNNRQRNRLRSFLGLLHFILVLIILLQHGRLNALLDTANHTIRDSKLFYQLHVTYLILVGIQWFLMLVYVWLTLAAWRSADRIVRSSPPPTERP